jgi:transposase
MEDIPMGKSTTSKSKPTEAQVADIQTDKAKAAFAGIDFHKRFSVVTLGSADGTVLSQHKLLNVESDIEKFFLANAPLVCAIENCRGNEWFVELVKRCGNEVRIGNTHVIRLIADSTKKNDKIDSKFLMDLVARNYLPVCYQPTRNERILRERLRWRTKMMRSRTQYKNVAHAILDKENKGARLSSPAGRDWLQEQSGLTPERHEQLQECFQIVDFFDSRMEDADRELIHLSKENPDVQRLKTIPGVGDLSALLLLAELGDINRFKSARHVAGYIGLVPRLYASSDVRRLGRITKQGPGLLRRILVQDAWMAVRQPGPFKIRYASILKRRGKKAAIVAIARMLAEIAFRILRDKTEFDEKKMTLG